MATATSLIQKKARKTRERIDVRLRPEQKAEIERAARIKGLTMTDFILQNAVSSARQAIQEHETWTLQRPDAELFAAALLEPIALGPRLTQVAKDYTDRFLQR